MIFLILLAKTYVVGTKKELSKWDGSFEHPKHMFKLMGMVINAILGAQTILIWTNVFYKQTTKVQTSSPIGTIWSEAFFSTIWKVLLYNLLHAEFQCSS